PFARGVARRLLCRGAVLVLGLLLAGGTGGKRVRDQVLAGKQLADLVQRVGRRRRLPGMENGRRLLIVRAMSRFGGGDRGGAVLELEGAVPLGGGHVAERFLGVEGVRGLGRLVGVGTDLFVDRLGRRRRRELCELGR